ncbi:HNH endonuclease, partial [Bacillus subtilis]
MKARDGDIIDHVSGDTCDNRKDNLRFVTHKQNCANKESKGYYFNKPTGKWLAQIQIDGKRKSLG